MTTKARVLAVCIGVVLIGKAALAQDGPDGSPPNSAPAAPSTAATPWGPVPTKKKSLVNLEPWLLPFFNNAPIFGIPGTVTGNAEYRGVVEEWQKPRLQVNQEPWLLPFFNNAPIFGIPGTVTGNLWRRTQLTGE